MKELLDFLLWFILVVGGGIMIFCFFVFMMTTTEPFGLLSLLIVVPVTTLAIGGYSFLASWVHTCIRKKLGL